MAKKKRPRTTGATPKKSLIKHHLPKVRSALLEGENRDILRAFLKEYEKQGLYALYDEKGALYYVGKATDVMTRLDAHKKDRHAGKWDSLAFYVLEPKENIHELESMVIAIADPPGNENKGKIKGSLKKSLGKYWLTQAKEELNSVLMVEKSSKKQSKQAPADKRLTNGKLQHWVDTVGVKKAGSKLGISGPYVSILRKDSSKFRKWIIGAGKKASVIVALADLEESS